MKKQLDALRMDMNKLFGENAVVSGTVAETFKGKVIPTGSIGMDKASGIGGWPMGKIVEIYGWESCGKTTLALEAILECQMMGLDAAFVDAEHALDLQYAAALGIDIENLLISQPDNGEQALEIAEKYVKSGLVSLVIVDSVAALVPKAELAGEMGDSKMGLHARLMSQAMRKMTGLIKKSNCCVIFINQKRMKIGVMFGNPETTTGGNALKFYASIRVEVRKKESPNAVDKQTDAHSITTTAKYVKNKCAPPFRKAVLQIGFGTGVDRFAEIVQYGIELGVIEKKGSWYSYNGTKIGQGEEKVKELLASNEKVRDEIENKIYEKF